ncbi:hypothetical protein LAWI1_G004452 [Lachnellula willkommii]|uniref:Uncharacterized protein n=1 Tax=Lachnellula willkommii TaxID=215461 RepID=A0A559M5P4_9HELO|nr:hypothetical protein LAWI1_G004452 [Lachnellula willkommii]
MAKKKTTPTSPLDLKSTSQKNGATLSDLQSNFDLWHRILVLLHDLSNIATDRAAEARTLCTTDELYISGPTVVSAPTQDEVPEFEALALDANEPAKAKEKPTLSENMTIEEAITSCLENFFGKRRASGDARPCGPHDMGPIYREVFGVSKDDLRDEKFLSRLRRLGLGQVGEKAVEGANSSSKQKKKGGKRG